MKKNSKNIVFEEAVSQLEEITRQLESGSLSLDHSVDAYERGMELSSICKAMLEKAEGRLLSLEAQKETKDVKENIISNDEDMKDNNIDQDRLFQ